MRNLLIFTLLFSVRVFAINQAPKALRACINFKDSTVTVSWKPAIDDCGSFSHRIIYANENNTAYTKIATITDYSVNEHLHNIENNNPIRSYYITTYFACNGIDSFISDTLIVDQTLPTITPLDSVSFDLFTQEIIAGWKSNPATDIDGYQIYNKETGNGDSIGYTKDTHFIVSTNPLNVFPVSLAVKDSCNNSGPQSASHTPNVISGVLDTCLNQVVLSWTKYKGWNTLDSQAIFVSKNNGRFLKITTLDGSPNSLSYSNFTLGDRFVFYIRSYTNNATITSSSNTLEFVTRALRKPSNLDLNVVTVNNSETISIKWSGKGLTDISRFDVMKSFNSVDFHKVVSKSANINEESYSVADNLVDPSLRSYYYYIVAVDKCGNAIDSSAISRSIHFSIDNANLESHNTYIGWDVGVSDYILYKIVSGSTWKQIEYSSSPILSSTLTDSSGCYVIQAVEATNQHNQSALSSSNIVCILDSLNVYIPSAINPQSQNNRFTILGQGIDHTKSNYSIYNRWGEQIVSNPTDKPWDLSYKNTLITPGVYIYTLNLYGLLGERETKKGIFNVIR